MPKVRFCYEIAKEEGLAITSEGQNAKAYTEISLDFPAELTPDEYKTLHTYDIKRILCKRTDFNLENVRPISNEEYDENNALFIH